MSNFTRKHFFVILLCSVAFISKVSAQQTLYAITGASGAPSTLYKLDAGTGAVISTVGSTGFSNVTALAINPLTGEMYGYSNPSFGSGSLIKIDRFTGKGTLIRNLDLQIPDMTFNSSGVLYAWAEQAGSNFDDLFILDVTTGSSTRVGECGCNTTSTGLAFSPSGQLFLKNKDAISQMDPATGTILSTIGLAKSTQNMLAFDASNQAYTGWRGNGTFMLQKINVVTGLITNVGSNSIDMVSALVFGTTLPSSIWYLDADGDQYAVSSLESLGNPGPGYTLTVLPITDCNDADATINPSTVWYLDNDGDNYAVSTVQSCAKPGPGFTRNILPVTDCNDADATINPLTTWYLDADGDMYAISTMQSCTSPGVGYTRSVLPVTDCNDANASINPSNVWYLDADGDQFAISTLQSCLNPGAGYTKTVLPVTDCDDTKIFYQDNDNDGFGVGSPIPCGGVTNMLDCDDTKILYADVDGDGLGYGSPAACGVANNTDNCTAVANPTQKDFDNDGIGDVCDALFDVCSAIEDLTLKVNTYVDKNKDADKLSDKLEKALDDIIKDKVNLATNDLSAFINKVESKIGKKDGLTAEEAAELIAMANTIIYALENDLYTVPCDATAGQVADEVLWMPIVQPLDLKFRVSPNPNRGQFTIQLNNRDDTGASILIMDAKGAVVERKNVGMTASQTISFDLGNRAGGLYIVKVTSKNGSKIAKIMVQK